MNKNPSDNIKLFKKESSNFKEIDKQWIDSSKLKSIGWSPKKTFDEGLKSTIDFYSKIGEVCY